MTTLTILSVNVSPVNKNEKITEIQQVKREVVKIVKEQPKQEEKIDWIDIVATGYCNCYKCTQNRENPGITASGKRASRGTIAMPVQYKFNTVLHIEGLGDYTNHDRGGAIVKRNGVVKIDIWFPTHQEALDFGVKHLKGYVKEVK